MFTALWVPTKAQLGAISDWFWTGNILETIKRYFTEITDSIISLHAVPFPIETTYVRQFELGMAYSDIPCNYTTQQFYDLDCGSIEIMPY